MTELSQEFQEFRKILCVCPCCGDLVRVSDLHIQSRGRSRKETWLDEYDKKLQLIEKKLRDFEEKEKVIREESRNASRLAAEDKIFELIHPCFKELSVNSNDIKPILHPIDFIIFQNMNKGPEINEIIFLSMKYHDQKLQKIRNSVSCTISEKNYEWLEARIDNKGDVVFK